MSKIHREFEGEVTGVSAKKTVRVGVDVKKMHPKYRKQYVIRKQYAVHDEWGDAKLGDVIRFQECRPISKTKRWRLVGVVKKAIALAKGE